MSRNHTMIEWIAVIMLLDLFILQEFVNALRPFWVYQDLVKPSQFMCSPI